MVKNNNNDFKMTAVLQSSEIHVFGTMKNPKADWKSRKNEHHLSYAVFRHYSLGLRALVMLYLLSYFSFCKSFLYKRMKPLSFFILWKFCSLQTIRDLSSWTSISGFALQAPCINIGYIADHRVWGQHSFLGQPTGPNQSHPIVLASVCRLPLYSVT